MEAQWKLYMQLLSLEAPKTGAAQVHGDWMFLRLSLKIINSFLCFCFFFFLDRQQNHVLRSA